MAVALQDLKSALPQLSGSNAETAESILNYWEQRGSISVAQAALAERLIARSKSVGAPVPASATGQIRALFDRARAAGLVYPSVRLAPGVVLSPATPNSKYPGTIQIKEGGADTVWYGRIEADGRINKGRDWHTDVDVALAVWMKDPAAAATAYGKATGCCSFCAKQLTDGRSVAMGYGPVCASNYGLPWGEKVAGDVEVAAA